MISFEAKGNFKKANSFLERMKEVARLGILDKYGREGVRALKSATPRDTGKTADSWSYEIVRKKDSVTIYWKNSNINDGVPIAVLIQYGHGTGTGGFVKGEDFINPAIRPIFGAIAYEAYKELSSI